jgi:Spy/CpxP family protein refolding chaperone
MNVKLLGMSAALAGLLAVTGVARAEWHHGGPGGGGGMEFLHGLNLTDAQKAQIKEIHKANWASMKTLMTQEHALREQEINQLLTAGNVTAEQMSSIVAQEEAVRNQIDAARMDSIIKMRNVLTADQLAKAATLHTQMEQIHAQEHSLMESEHETPPE